MAKDLKKLYSRYKREEETLHDILIRPLFLVNRLKHKPVKVLQENWQYLIILDACRYDLFEKANFLEGKLEKKYSAGTHTGEWLRNNFDGNTEDVIYISSTPQVSEIKLKERLDEKNPFFHLENVWNWGWNEKLGTVHPKTVNQTTLKITRKYPNKRIIIHYMQPHSPFIGNPKLGHAKSKEEMNFRWQEKVRNNKLSLKKVKKAYIGNLKLVLKCVEDLIENLDGKIIVTADHGEAFGEYGIFSHPPGMYIKSLIEVPWFTIKV